MSMITSAPFIETSPAPRERPQMEERAASEVARKRLVNRVGFWAAVVTAAGALGWVVAVTLATAYSFPAGQWGLVTQFVPSLFLALAYVVLMVAIRERTAVERRIWPSIAVAFATIYATLNATVYFVELMLVTPHKLSGALGDLGFLDMQQGLFLFVVDVFGYLLMSLAAAFVAPAFTGSQTRLERWIFWLLLANWLLVLFGPLVLLWSGIVSLSLLWAALWTLMIPVPAILLAVLFRRDRPVALSEAKPERPI
jgi:hypothetical protein